MLNAIFAVFLITYDYAKRKGSDGITSGVLSICSFLMIMPHSIKFLQIT